MVTKKRKISNDFNKIFQYAKRETQLESFFLQTELQDNLKLLKVFQNTDAEEYMISFLIVRSITFFEVSMMNLTRHIVDNLDPDLSLIFHEEWNIPTSKIPELLNQKLKKSDIVTASFNFQDRDEITPILSKLLKLDFEESIKKISTIDHSDEIIVASKNLVQNWHHFEQVFTMRHNVVHSWYLVGKRTYDYVSKLVNSVIDYVRLSIFLIIGLELYHKSNLSIPIVRKFLHERLEDYKKR